MSRDTLHWVVHKTTKKLMDKLFFRKQQLNRTRPFIKVVLYPVWGLNHMLSFRSCLNKLPVVKKYLQGREVSSLPFFFMERKIYVHK